MKKRLLLLTGVLTYGIVQAQGTFDNLCVTLRNNWKTFITENLGRSTFDDSDAKAYDNSLERDSNRTYLWEDYNYDDYKSSDITTSYRRVKVMAQAYCTPGSSSYQNPTLKHDIINSLNWLNKYWYNPGVIHPNPYIGSNIRNWWDYQIGTPLELNNTITMMFFELSSTERANMLGTVDHFTRDYQHRYGSKDSTNQVTGANRVWFSTVIALRAILAKDSVKLYLADTGLNRVFPYVTTGDGFYKDGSFIQHGDLAYNGGYGVSLLSTLIDELYMLSPAKGRTPTYYPTDPGLANISNWIYDSYATIIYKGGLLSNTMGREISRSNCEEQDKARLVAQAVALYATTLPAAEQPKMKGLVKAWMTDGSPALTSPARYQKYIDSIMSNNSIVANRDLDNAYRQFANMDRVIQRTPSYAFSVSMFSPRIDNFECRRDTSKTPPLWLENKKGWHTGDGMTYLYTTDTSQFNDNFWPTVNAYRLPGTTVEENTQQNGYLNNVEAWVGGSSLLNKYGSTGMDFDPKEQPHSGKKSWFMLDGKIACLGAGIVTSGSKDIHTYIENRKLKIDNSNTFVVNDAAVSATDTSLQTFANASWAHLSGPLPGSDIGYYFPTSFTLNAQRNSSSGSWYDLNYNQNKTVYTHRYLMLWKNHGQPGSPGTNATKYEYILLPGRSRTTTKSYAANPDVLVLRNDTYVQAVKDNTGKILAANFWEDMLANLEVGGVASYLTCNKKASVTMKQSNDTLYLALSDPTMLNTGTIEINLKEGATSSFNKDAAITTTLTSTNIKVVLNAANLKGRSCAVAFKLVAGAQLNRSGSANGTQSSLAAEDTKESKLSAIVSPNPAHHAATLKLANAKNGKVQIALLNMNNIAVRNFDSILSAKESTINLPLKGIPAGVYVVLVKNSTATAQQKLVIQ